jgi:hypothetical protein
MRSSSALDDAVLQSRRLTIQHFRPLAWAHARDGIVQTASTGRINEIDTRLSFTFRQFSDPLRPIRGFTAGRVGIRRDGTNRTLVTQTISAFTVTGDFTIAILWFCSTSSGNVPQFSIKTTGSDNYLELSNGSGQNVRAMVGSATTGDISISTNRPYIAVLTVNNGSQTGALYCDGSSTSATDNGLSLEDVFGQIRLLDDDTICYEAVVFSRELQTRERQLLEGVMAWNNNLPNALPGNHPFALRPPLIGD